MKIDMSTATTSFRVDGQWYDIPYTLLRWIQKTYRTDTNREIVEAVRAAPDLFTVTELGNLLIITRKVRS